MDITLILSQTTQAIVGTDVESSSKASAAAGSSGGDTVTISEEGQALAAAMTASGQAYTAETADSGESEDGSSSSSTLETLKKLIEQLEKEIEEIEASELPEEEKESKLSSLRTALVQTQLEYAQALQEESGTAGGTLLSALGSEAEGFADSLT